ncbi:hypothetical protein SAMN06295912_108143 [Sphingomonas laterariae]|uniref:Uncharacterized protein n=1 Tax=Edaphosphingomonas laterariae TaxID=861865 RepID=A0A239FBW4_9SPHN|nr:hypothetical protein [Sphingomonas laterariae]SNS53793.1 hypothetical protein SAMN06295912_108143 [Sphingomonas laterariae]
MTDATAQPVSSNFIPFVADVHSKAFVGRVQQNIAGISLHFLDERQRIIASSLCAIEDVERFAYDLLAIATATRAADPKIVPIGQMPRNQTSLMHGLRRSDAA